ncbi:DUF982 domain-containing protein [Paracoccus simplex]|uniref:DUF982 domain-containing protein n=1 Tax=Paracoccus simplex TaxID=2086346 RepID=A0ABV7RWN5_9RHOB
MRGGQMPSAKTIRPVTFEEGIGRFRTVNNARGMGEALLAHCDQGDPEYQIAALACLGLESGAADPEQARADFIAALTAAGVYVRDS